MSKRHSRKYVSVGRRHARGLSLVELMVSLVLGLLVTGAAINVFVSNRQTYRATESLGRVQENARVAFELMARDVREAGGNPCAKNLPMANAVNDGELTWWTDFGDGIVGVEGAFASDNPPNRVAGTDAVELKSGHAGAYTISGNENTKANTPDAELTLSTPDHDLRKGDILLVCDNRQASIFQMTGPATTNQEVIHSSNSGGLKPGNCTKGLGLPVLCTQNGNSYPYEPNSQIVKLRAVRWYVGTNDRGGQSLYRYILRNDSGNAGPVVEEVTEGVDRMEISYLLPGANSYVSAGSIPASRWNDVRAARIEILLEGADGIGPDGELIERRLVHTVTLRNRNA
jgi:type IV pilus assembly protein PilW